MHFSRTMSTFLRGHSTFLLSLGAGIAIGACASFALRRLTSSIDQKLAKLMTSIEQLQREVHELKIQLEQAVSIKKQVLLVLLFGK